MRKQMRRISMIPAVLSLAILTTPAFAHSTTTKTSSGSGSVLVGGQTVKIQSAVAAAKVFNITTTSQLVSLEKESNGSQASSIANSTINIWNNLTITNSNGWAPMFGLSTTPFTGTFNGNGHVINFSNITGGPLSSNVATFGLLQYNSGKIENVGTTGIFTQNLGSPSGIGVFSGLVGKNSGTIENSYSSLSETIKAGFYGEELAGLVDYNVGTIENSYSSSVLSTVPATKYQYTGELVGQAGAFYDPTSYTDRLPPGGASYLASLNNLENTENTGWAWGKVWQNHVNGAPTLIEYNEPSTNPITSEISALEAEIAALEAELGGMEAQIGSVMAARGSDGNPVLGSVPGICGTRGCDNNSNPDINF